MGHNAEPGTAEPGTAEPGTAEPGTAEPGTVHVVVAGGGFAGIACAHRLAGEPRARVTLLDRHGYHQFQPLLYQVATAELAPDDIRFDLASMFRRHDNVAVRTAEVVSVDPRARSATLDDGSTIEGDVLVLAAGARPNFFHTPGADRFALPLYSADDADRIRSRLLRLFQDADTRPEPTGESALNLVVIGGGPTGVETAGALAELVHDVLPHDEHIASATITLVDAGHALLAGFSDEAHDYAAKQLQRRGVRVRLGVSATQVGPDHVSLSDGTTIGTHVTIWAGGECAAPLAAQAGLPRGHGGRIDVRPDLTVAGHPAVYALGDFANIPSADESVLPQLGSVAKQAGDWAGANIIADLEGSGRTPFHYRDKGIMAMIGRKAAIAEIGEHRHELHGRFAFAAWLGVHAELLANARAELTAFTTWAEEFYLRPHHRRPELLDPAAAETHGRDIADSRIGST